MGVPRKWLCQSLLGGGLSATTPHACAPATPKYLCHAGLVPASPTAHAGFRAFRYHPEDRACNKLKINSILSWLCPQPNSPSARLELPSRDRALSLYKLSLLNPPRMIQDTVERTFLFLRSELNSSNVFFRSRK